jgi:four helix bundle protein
MKEYDIKARTTSFSKDLLKFTQKLDRKTENQVLAKQIIRSGTSIGANVHESKGGTSVRDFSHYFSIALKSANETEYWLALISSINPELRAEIYVLSEELKEIACVLAKIVINSRKKDLRP